MSHFYTRFSFLIGIALGVLLAIYYQRSVIQRRDTRQLKEVPHYEKWFKKQSDKRKNSSWDLLRYTSKTYYSEAQYLFDKIEVLCIVLVKEPKNFNAAKDTWAKGCNHIQPIHLESKTKALPIKRSKEKSSWVLLCKALNEITSPKIQWVLIVKDTTFAIMENLRYYLAPLDKNDKHYLGHAAKFWGVMYNLGDAGYVLSKGAVRSFQKNIGKEKCMAYSYWNKEDFYLGKYLATLNVTPIDTFDNEGYSLFYPYTWFQVFYPGENYYKSSVFLVNCCSKRSVTFQATDSSKMYTLYYLFYTLQIFIGGAKGNRPHRETLGDDKVWQQFLSDQNVPAKNVTSEEYYKLWEDLINDPNSFAKNMKKENLFDYD